MPTTVAGSRAKRLWSAAAIILALAAAAAQELGGSTSASAAAERSSSPRSIAGDVVISPEYPVSDPGGSSQSAPSVAFDGTNYLVSWTEGTSPATVRGGRVDRFGQHLDGPGVSIAPGDAPSVAFDGTNYLVAWMTVDGRPEIKAARVSPDDVVLDPNGIQITYSGMYEWQYLGGVAYEGTNYLVVWTDATDISGQENIRGAHVSPAREA